MAGLTAGDKGFLKEFGILYVGVHLLAIPLAIGYSMDEKDKRDARARQLGLEARIPEIREISGGDFNGDGFSDQLVFYTDGRTQYFLHRGYRDLPAGTAPDSAETYLKQSPRQD